MADVPHFDAPLRLSGSSFAAVEQNSKEEIADCVEAVLRTEAGSRIDAPEFGRPDETFEQLSPSVSAEPYLSAVARDEPRAHLLGEAEVEGMTKQVSISPERT